MRFGRRCRLKRRQDIDRLFEQGSCAADRLLTLRGAPNGLNRTRAAMGVSSRHGGAVRRNRVKRLCREAFRLVRPELPVGWDYIVIPRPGRQITLEGLQDALRSLAQRVACKHASGEGAS